MGSTPKGYESKRTGAAQTMVGSFLVRPASRPWVCRWTQCGGIAHCSHPTCSRLLQRRSGSRSFFLCRGGAPDHRDTQTLDASTTVLVLESRALCHRQLRIVLAHLPSRSVLAVSQL